MIRSFRDLEVYQNSYKTSIIIIKEILPKLPDHEKYDLRDQLSRSCKAVPRLIAEGFSKKHQKAGFHKYLSDAMAESNETIVSLSHCRDLYLDKEQVLCNKLIDTYDKTSRQLFKLNQTWTNFTEIRTNEKGNSSIELR